MENALRITTELNIPDNVSLSNISVIQGEILHNYLLTLDSYIELKNSVELKMNERLQNILGNINISDIPVTEVDLTTFEVDKDSDLNLED